MPGFTFGAPSATSTPLTGGATTGATGGTSLFGSTSAAKPLFGTTATTTTASTTQPATLFGTPATAAAAKTTGGGLFGTATAVSSAPSTGLFGAAGTTTATTAAPTATGGLFGGATQSKGLFGTTTTSTAPATSTSGGLFGKPTTGGLFGSAPATTAPLSSSTSTGGGLFGAGATATTSSVSAGGGLGGLGGTAQMSSLGGGTATSTATTSAVGGSGAAVSTNPMDGEVPKQLLDLINQLNERLKKNRELSDEFVMNSNDSCITMNEKLDEVKKFLVKETSDLRRIRCKANVLVEKIERDTRAAEQSQRRQKEMTKVPRHGYNHAMDYLQSTCSDYETLIAEFNETLLRIEHIISTKLNRDPNKPQLTHSDLMGHLKRFDQVFKVIASEVYRCNQQVQDAKEALLEYRRRTMPYAPNPFEKKLDTVQNAIALSKYVGAEAFPSQVTMMKIGELARAATHTQPTATTGFGTGGSLFGAKPLGSTPFSFSTPSTGTTATPLFKPFSTPSTSTTTPLFGSSTTSTTGGAQASAAPSSSSFTFGNTLNSSVSGTLFGGSASKPLFGK